MAIDLLQATSKTTKFSPLPLLMLIAILMAAAAAIYAFICGCGFIEILWSYSKTGTLTLIIGVLFPLFAPA